MKNLTQLTFLFTLLLCSINFTLSQADSTDEIITSTSTTTTIITTTEVPNEANSTTLQDDILKVNQTLIETVTVDGTSSSNSTKVEDDKSTAAKGLDKLTAVARNAKERIENAMKTAAAKVKNFFTRKSNTNSTEETTTTKVNEISDQVNATTKEP